jgi:tetratricopeptide (TPR) repeat protein
LLDLKDKELGTTRLSREEKIKEAEDWAKRYRELEARLAAQGAEDTLAQQAKAALEQGDLNRAGELLDEILKREEKTVDKATADHFNRAQVYQLQFQPLQALPHLEKAYRYRPEKVAYALAYAKLLQEQHEFKPAETIYTEILSRLREQAKIRSRRLLAGCSRDPHQPGGSLQRHPAAQLYPSPGRCDVWLNRREQGNRQCCTVIKPPITLSRGPYWQVGWLVNGPPFP